MSDEPAAGANKALIRAFVRAINDRDYDAFTAIVAPDFRRHCPATPDVEVRCLADFVAFLEADLVTFPDSVVTLETLVAEGDLVAYWAIYTATQTGPMGPFPPSGRRAVVPFAGHFRIEDGVIAELWATWDNVDILRQLGHMPDETPAGGE